MSRERKVLSIKQWPPKIDHLSDREFIAWVRGATGLSQQEALQNPRLARDRLLAALKRERAAARRKRKGRSTPSA
jgi:hypothetical protein